MGLGAWLGLKKPPRAAHQVVEPNCQNNQPAIGTRKKFGVFGNCQATAIASILADHEPFVSQFEIIPITPVYLMNAADLAALRNQMERFDVFLSQDVSGHYSPADARSLI